MLLDILLPHLLVLCPRDRSLPVPLLPLALVEAPAGHAPPGVEAGVLGAADVDRVSPGRGQEGDEAVAEALVEVRVERVLAGQEDVL